MGSKQQSLNRNEIRSGESQASAEESKEIQSSSDKTVSGSTEDSKAEMGSSNLSQETIDAAAQVTTDEAMSEGQLLATSMEESNLVKSLNTLEEGSLENTLDKSLESE